MKPNGYGNGCGPNQQLPSCNVRGYTDYLPDVPRECERFAQSSGKELCVTHAGAIALNQPNTGLIALNVDPGFSTAYWAQLLTICIFDVGAQTRVLNAQIADVQIRGSSQFASQNVPICGFDAVMPFLGVAWDMADSTNPIQITFTVRSAGNVDISVFTTGYGIR
jgi:hypothetical protein